MYINLIQLLVLVLVFGLVWYVITVIPLPQPFKMVAIVILAVILIVWLLSVAGLLGTGGVVRIGP
jgi:hypothetical protein